MKLSKQWFRFCRYINKLSFVIRFFVCVSVFALIDGKHILTKLQVDHFAIVHSVHELLRVYFFHSQTPIRMPIIANIGVLLKWVNIIRMMMKKNMANEK